MACRLDNACRRCSNYIFILDLTHGFIGLGKYNCKTRREAFKFGDLARLILEVLRYMITLIMADGIQYFGNGNGIAA